MITHILALSVSLAAPMLATASQDATAAKAHADAVIARSGASAYFVNVTDDAQPRVRHVASGLTCVFNIGDPRDVINLYPVQPNGPVAGDDVGCGSWRGEVYVSVFATRYPQKPPAEALFNSAIRDIYRSWDNTRPAAEEFPIVVLPGQETPLAAAFTGVRSGQTRLNVVVLRNMEDWTFKARGTGPVDDGDTTLVTSHAFALAIPGGWEASRAAD